jgi:hypothetical protein
MPKGKYQTGKTKKPTASQIILAVFSVLIVLSVVLQLFINR